MRERGLKPSCGCVPPAVYDVAPHAGAWIETLSFIPYMLFIDVAPHAGAWIETQPDRLAWLNKCCRSPCGSVD